MPCTCELAATVGQDKPVKDGVEAYDRAYGAYQPHDHNHKSTTPPNQPTPIKNIGGGK